MTVSNCVFRFLAFEAWLVYLFKTPSKPHQRTRPLTRPWFDALAALKLPKWKSSSCRRTAEKVLHTDFQHITPLLFGT